MSQRIDAFPTSTEEAVGMAVTLRISPPASLFSFSEWPDDLVIAREVTGHSACPCHSVTAPWSVAELVRVSLVRFDNPDPAENWLESIALCSLHNGVQVAAELQGKLAHNCVVTGESWRELNCSDKTCCPPEGRPIPIVARPTWSGRVDVSPVIP